jgi:hypothetical protein
VRRAYADELGTSCARQRRARSRAACAKAVTSSTLTPFQRSAIRKARRSGSRSARPGRSARRRGSLLARRLRPSLRSEPRMRRRSRRIMGGAGGRSGALAPSKAAKQRGDEPKPMAGKDLRLQGRAGPGNRPGAGSTGPHPAVRCLFASLGAPHPSACSPGLWIVAAEPGALWTTQPPPTGGSPPFGGSFDSSGSTGLSGSGARRLLARLGAGSTRVSGASSAAGRGRMCAK